jgi:hypothetical protein
MINFWGYLTIDRRKIEGADDRWYWATSCLSITSDCRSLHMNVLQSEIKGQRRKGCNSKLVEADQSKMGTWMIWMVKGFHFSFDSIAKFSMKLPRYPHFETTKPFINSHLWRCDPENWQGLSVYTFCLSLQFFPDAAQWVDKLCHGRTVYFRNVFFSKIWRWDHITRTKSRGTHEKKIRSMSWISIWIAPSSPQKKLR